MRLTQRAENILLPIAAVILALLVGAVLIWLDGSNPWTAYTALIDGALGDKDDLARTLGRRRRRSRSPGSPSSSA